MNEGVCPPPPSAPASSYLWRRRGGTPLLCQPVVCAHARDRDHPGYRTLLNTLGPIENFFPRVPGVTPGAFHMWHRKHADFARGGWDVLTYVAAFGGSATNFYVADADALRDKRA